MSLMKVNFYAVTALPQTLEADSFYYVVNGSFAESYVTDSAGAAKSIGNSVMINQLVADALASWEATSNQVSIVADIAARDALTAAIEKNAMILVIDATADPTVDMGSALYAYDFATETTYKVAEYESMDVVVQWGDLEGRPNSSVAQIDDAVGKAHQHSNMATLNKLSEAGGELMFDGEAISSQWVTKDW